MSQEEEQQDTTAAAEKKSMHTRTNRIFLLGISTILPALLTVVILYKSYEFINESLALPINAAIIKLIAGWKDVPIPEVQASYPHVVGFAIAFSIFFLVGFLFASFIGKRVFQILETWISHIPVISAIYPHAKQLVEFFSSNKQVKVDSVVAFEYPRKGLYTIGFVTGEGLKDVEAAAGSDVVSVFVPSSPTPISGYAVFIPRKDVLPLDMTVEEVFRYSMSAGVLLPDKNKKATT